jgi:hypothetical protein
MVTSTKRLVLALAATLGILGSFACNAVLGITPATEDPALSKDAGAPEAAATDAGTDTAPVDNPYSCKGYCEAIAKNCAGTNQEYTSTATCIAMCQHFEPGVAGEQTNDSLACRVYHAGQAANDPATLCQQGGPLAAGGCTVSPCAAFCTLGFDLCNPQGLFPYDGGEPACRSACANWKYFKSADGDAGVVGDILFASGNSLNCRLYHLESAYEVDNPSAVTTHCPHIADVSATCN